MRKFCVALDHKVFSGHGSFGFDIFILVFEFAFIVRKENAHISHKNAFSALVRP